MSYELIWPLLYENELFQKKENLNTWVIDSFFALSIAMLCKIVLQEYNTLWPNNWPQKEKKKKGKKTKKERRKIPTTQHWLKSLTWPVSGLIYDVALSYTETDLDQIHLLLPHKQPRMV